MNDCGVTYEELELVTTESTMFDRWTERARVPRWLVIALIGIVLGLIPFVLARFDGLGPMEWFDGFRAQLVYAVMVVYMLAILRPLEGTRTSVAVSLRPLIEIDRSDFVSLVNRSCRLRPLYEMIAFGLGVTAGMLINLVFEPLQAGPYWLNHYAYLSRIGIFGIGIWCIFVVMSITRMTNVLLAQPTRVDVFNPQPFAPVGRQSALLSLAIVGAVTLSLFSASFMEPALWLEYVINYCVFLLVIVALFLLNTHVVHRVIAAAKADRLLTIEGYLARACREFEERLSAGKEVHEVATQINALATLKHEVQLTRTWPYNTEMLRTVAISVVTPIVVGLSRVLIVLLSADKF